MAYHVGFMRVLTFFLCDDRVWVVSSKLCFVLQEDLHLVFLPSNGDMDRAMPSLASADVTLTFSEGAGLGNLLRSVKGQAAAVGAGWLFRRTRSMCTLLAICCSNEQIYAGIGGKVGHLAPKQCVRGEKRRGQSNGDG